MLRKRSLSFRRSSLEVFRPWVLFLPRRVSLEFASWGWDLVVLAASPRMKAVVVVIISSIVFGNMLVQVFRQLWVIYSLHESEDPHTLRSSLHTSSFCLETFHKSSMVSPSLCLMLWISTGSLTIPRSIICFHIVGHSCPSRALIRGIRVSCELLKLRIRGVNGSTFSYIHGIVKSSSSVGAARVWFDELRPESIDSYKDLKAAFLAYFMQQKKYVKDPVEIHNIKPKDGETIEDFMERFKVETGHMKGASAFIRGEAATASNPELTKCLNEYVPKTMEEMMITTTAFIRGEAATASKKKGHTSWRTQDQSKWQTLEKRSDFQGQPREGRVSSRFTHLTKTPKEILAAEA
nr:reverse transcriptase domain-containing protein [Tanacetum cinerariifolium]